MKLAKPAARLVQATQKAYMRKWGFLLVFLSVFFMSFSLLVALDWVPEAPKPESRELVASPLVAAGLSVPAEGQLPSQIDIPSIGLSATIENPTSTKIEVLDRELEKGAVRYPTSAKLGEEGNVILFGHSSYLPVVANRAFKAFNEIQKLEKGDRIIVRGDTHVFVYAVESVVETDAESAAIPLTVEGSKLTLATCDSFGEKSDRFVVVAGLVESYPVGN
jgi:LPXTG-site transpeptidase (sortase) family protein